MVAMDLWNTVCQNKANKMYPNACANLPKYFCHFRSQGLDRGHDVLLANILTLPLGEQENERH